MNSLNGDPKTVIATDTGNGKLKSKLILIFDIVLAELINKLGYLLFIDSRH